MPLTKLFLRYWALCALSAIATAAAAQGADKVYLNNGGTYTGDITVYEPAEGVWLQISGEVEARFFEVAALRRIFFSRSQPNLLPSDRIVNDIVRLLDGAYYRGRLLGYRKGAEVSLAIDTRTVLILKEEAVYRIDFEQRVATPPAKSARRDAKGTTEAGRAPREPREYAFREKGPYQAITVGAMLAEGAPTARIIIFDPLNPFIVNDDPRTTFGYSMQYVRGWQFNRWQGVGGGVSADAYQMERGEILLNALAQYRAYFTRRKVGLYGVLDAGYGFAFRNERQGISEARGGFLLHPAVGLRLGARKDYNFTVDLGYRFQQARYTQTLPFSGDTEVRELFYKRLSLRVGIVY